MFDTRPAQKFRERSCMGGLSEENSSEAFFVSTGFNCTVAARNCSQAFLCDWIEHSPGRNRMNGDHSFAHAAIYFFSLCNRHVAPLPKATRVFVPKGSATEMRQLPKMAVANAPRAVLSRNERVGVSHSAEGD